MRRGMRITSKMGAEKTGHLVARSTFQYGSELHSSLCREKVVNDYMSQCS